MRSLLAVSVLLSAFSMVRANSIVFQENFDGAPSFVDNDTTTGSPLFAGSLFTLTSGSVDVNGPGFYSELCSAPLSNFCVDTTGSGNARGVITSTVINFTPGTYMLTFDLTGWNFQGLTETASVEVTLGSLIDQTFFRDGNLDPYPTVSIPFVVGSGTSASLVFSDLSGSAGFAGAVLDNIQIDAIPEPASFVLAGSALAALGMLRKRKA